VQGHLEEVLARVAGTAVTVHGAGRTDAGVHAAGQVASVDLVTRLAPADLRRALNAQLPAAIRVRRVEPAAPGFHARFSARRKTYRYAIWNDPVLSPFARRYAWYVPQPLDAAAMGRGAAACVGRHDFAAFQSTGSLVSSAVRTISVAQVGEWGGESLSPIPGVAETPDEGRLLIVEVSANGFLRHMARTLVGTLVEIGAGRRHPDQIGRLLESRDRTLAGATAPPTGLWLMRVDY
jgi:tRNA pseudouridine38-40 synthase